MANRQNTFLLKRSNVPGKVPSPGDLKLGEIALNTADAILYASGTTANTILPIGWDRISRTGDTVTGNFVFIGGISAATISATTYYGLPIDVYVTGGTYSSGTATFTNNTGGTFTVTGFTAGSVSGEYLPLSGGTVTGATSFTAGLTANTIFTDYVDFNTGATVTAQVGRLRWNNADEIGGLEVGMRGGNVTLQVGEESLARVYNADSVTLTNGMIVYVYGSQGNTVSVKRASASGETKSAKALGVVLESIPVGGRGFVNTFGLVRDLDTSAYSGGTALWLGVTPGTFTSIKPQAPYHLTLIGFVSRVHPVTGSIFIHISNGWELDELHDVRTSGVTSGDLLVSGSYNGSNVWVNSTKLNGSYTFNNITVTGTTKSVTLSASTYLNLPKDIYVTGGTYSSGTATFTNNSGGTFTVTGFTSGSVSGEYLPLSGGTVTGATSFTAGLTSNTISATTYYNLPTKVTLDFAIDSTYTTSSTSFGQIPLSVVVQSASTYNGTYSSMNATLICDVSQSDATITGQFDLYNLTDGSSITGSATSFVNTDDLKKSASFSIPSSNFDDSLRVRLRRTSGTGANNVRIRAAQLILTLA